MDKTHKARVIDPACAQNVKVARTTKMSRQTSVALVLSMRRRKRDTSFMCHSVAEARFSVFYHVTIPVNGVVGDINPARDADS
jgi:hypothetical protein